MNRIPDRCDCAESYQHNAGIVHGYRGHGQRCWHAEQHQLEGNPQQRYHVDDWPNDATKIPSCFHDLFALVQQANGDRDGICQSQSLHTNRDESGKGASTAKVDQSQEHLYDSYQAQ